MGVEAILIATGENLLGVKAKLFLCLWAGFLVPFLPDADDTFPCGSDIFFSSFFFAFFLARFRSMSRDGSAIVFDVHFKQKVLNSGTMLFEREIS